MTTIYSLCTLLDIEILFAQKIAKSYEEKNAQWGRNEIFLGEDLFNKNFEITNF